MRYIIFLSVFFVGCNSKQKAISVYDESLYNKLPLFTLKKDGYEVFVHKNDPNRKMMKYYWDNGQVQLIGFFLQNKKDGRWTEFFENGSMSAEAFFVDDKKDSVHKTYYENGVVASIEKYNVGKKVGQWEYYDTSGKLDHKRNFDH